MSNPFDMMGGMGGLGGLLGGFQQKVKEIQEGAETATYTAQSGGGVVKATVNGKNTVISLDIDDSVLDDADMLGDLIVVAINNAQVLASSDMEQQMSAVTNGLPIPPGLLNF
jgi:DNA-binding YbaB/EbfC family protein